jgi:hypothetical protein
MPNAALYFKDMADAWIGRLVMQIMLFVAPFWLLWRCQPGQENTA